MNSPANAILYHPIGIIHSPYKESKGTPIQPVAGSGNEAVVEIYPDYAEGLKDIEGFSHLILIFHMHLIRNSQLKVVPFLDTYEHGVFATRAPGRPNPIGFSIVRLEKVEGTLLYIKDIDILDGSPLLDIKTFIPAFDIRNADRTGWFSKNDHDISKTQDDGRFC